MTFGMGVIMQSPLHTCCCTNSSIMEGGGAQYVQCQSCQYHLISAGLGVIIVALRFGGIYSSQILHDWKVNLLAID